MKSFITKAKILLYVVLGYDFVRIRYSDGAISVLFTLTEAVNASLAHKGSHIFVDYAYAERFFD